MRTVMGVLGVLAGAVLSLGVAAGEPPRVVSAVPDHGDSGVDPALAQIRIEFDQDMSPNGLSVCQAGAVFPQVRGKPTWESARVLVLNVTLQPGQDYALSINAPAFRNTRSVQGESAEITPIWFQTADKPGPGPTTAPAPEVWSASADELRRAIDERYSYRDRVVKDWDALFRTHRAAMDRARTKGQFARAAARLLGEARDPHISLRIGPAWVGTTRNDAPPNFNFDTLARTVPGWTRHNDVVSTGRFEDGVGYLLITSWPSDLGLLDPAVAFIGALGNAPGLVLDVRPNGGGNELGARRVAACLAGESAVYSRHRTRAADRPGGFTGLSDRTIAPGGDARYAGRVVVLMGPANLSSNESFLLMMRYGAKAMLVGQRSGGSSGNPKPVELACGVTVLLPSWEDYFPDGTLLEGLGIEPDFTIATVPAELATSDPVLREGLRRVRGEK